MKKNEVPDHSLHVGDRVRISEHNPTWNVENTLRDKIGEVIEIRSDGGVSVRFDGGRLLMGRSGDTFSKIDGNGSKARK